MTKFFLIRHLPTSYNRNGRLQGRRDIPIADPDTGATETVGHNRDLLARIGPFDAVLASSLIRTQMTAERYGLPYRIEPLLDELDFGPYEGRPKSVFIRETGRCWLDTPHLLTLGEPLTALQARIEQFIDMYSGAGRVLVFGHGAWIRAFICLRRFGTIAAMNRIEVDHNKIVAC